MIEILEFILIAAAVVLVLLWTIFAVRRLALLFSILALGRIEGVEVTTGNALSVLLPFTAKKPLATVKVRDKLYDLYLYHGGGRWKYVHIANEKYSVVFSKLGGMTPRGASRTLGTKKRVLINLPSGVSGAKVRLLPSPNTNGRIPLLVFSPEPAELTYVTKERNSIRVAFTGERIGDFRIFTKDTLARYIDRESRGFYDGLRADEE